MQGREYLDFLEESEAKRGVLSPSFQTPTDHNEEKFEAYTMG
jgi:hypothetical protein